jgi:hypothetical protein
LKWNFEVELFYCPLNYLNGRRHAQAGGGRKSHAALKCCWKGNMLLLIYAKASRKKGH